MTPQIFSPVSTWISVAIPSGSIWIPCIAPRVAANFHVKCPCGNGVLEKNERRLDKTQAHRARSNVMGARCEMLGMSRTFKALKSSGSCETWKNFCSVMRRCLLL